MRNPEHGKRPIKRVMSLLIVIFLLILSSAAYAANDEWTCPGCGREGNIYRFCGSCGTEKPASISLPDNFSAEQIQTGNILQFGRYEQDNNLENGAEPIRWIVLDRAGNRLLLLSQYGLDTHEYSASWDHTPWIKSSMFTWLNQEFIDAALTESEKAMILPVRLDANGLSRQYVQDAGRKNEENINYFFLISEEDAKQYLENNDRLRCAPTRYAIARGAYAGRDDRDAMRCWWWLRSWNKMETEEDPLMKTGPRAVNFNGERIYYGAANDHVAIRPACWVDLEKR